MLDLFKNMLPRLIQDGLTSLAAYLAANGFLASNQEQGFIGATFFLAMLAVNYFVAQSHRATAAQAGAAATGSVLSRPAALDVAKGKIP